MAAPFFFEENLTAEDEFILSEETSRHVVQVLRMKEDEQIILTNGQGYTKTAEIIFPDKKKTKVKIVRSEFREQTKPQNTIAISLIKNNNRLEWFLEKAAEMGISAIIPIICKRTEKIHFRRERMNSILISAMLQSQQSWLPEIFEPVQFSEVIRNEKYDQKFIAHCLNEEKNQLKNVAEKNSSKIILIGPEGDFTSEEIENALAKNYIPVGLGKTRLRTETAGLVAAVLLTSAI